MATTRHPQLPIEELFELSKGVDKLEEENNISALMLKGFLSVEFFVYIYEQMDNHWQKAHALAYFQQTHSHLFELHRAGWFTEEKLLFDLHYKSLLESAQSFYYAKQTMRFNSSVEQVKEHGLYSVKTDRFNTLKFLEEEKVSPPPGFTPPPSPKPHE